MYYNFKKIIVVDIECTCWEDKEKQRNESEIIEIGIALLNQDGLITNNQSIFVRPQKIDISEYCTNLTGITEQQIRQYGIPFNDACNRIKEEYGPKSKIWASYGEYDKKMFRLECERKNVEYPFSDVHFNVKILFTLLSKLNKSMGTRASLEKLNLQFDGRQHSGKDDAYNIAKILRRILQWD